MTSHSLDLRGNGEARASFDIAAEQELLGAVIFENETFHAVGEVAPEDFSEPFHQRLWAEIADRIGHGVQASPTGLARRFKDDGAFVALRGMAYIGDLVDRAPTARVAVAAAEIVRDEALRRRMAALAREMADAIATATGTAAEVLSASERAISDLARHGAHGDAWTGAGAITGAALAKAREGNGMVGLSTGLGDLDDAMGGLRKGQMIIVAGRPAMGKSTAALQLAKAVARKGRGAAFFSMEMPDFDLGLRLACDVAHDPLAKMYAGRSTNPSYFDAARGKLNDEQWGHLDSARDDIERWPLSIDVRPGLTVANMLAASRRKIREWERAGIEPGVIIVDHLTIARVEKERQGNKVAEVGDISRGLAEMAKTLDLPVVALCQLSRDVEKRDKDKRPTLADLRWSGEIEQDARVVMFLYRPEYYVRKPEDIHDAFAKAEYEAAVDKVRHKLFWLVEKNNNGPTGQVETYCNIACSAIRDRLGGGH